MMERITMIISGEFLNERINFSEEKGMHLCSGSTILEAVAVLQDLGPILYPRAFLNSTPTHLINPALLIVDFLSNLANTARMSL